MAEDEVDTKIFAPEPTPTPNSRYSESLNETNPSDNLLSSKVSRPADGECYDTTNDKRGIALVFNHGIFKSGGTREGTEKDRSAIVQTLEDFKFDVRVYDDFTVEGLREVLKEVAKEDHSKNDCLMVVVMSHGEQDKIRAYDSDYELKELWESFASDKCPSLIGKPKLFFIQACRGNNVDDGVIKSKSGGGDALHGKTVKSTQPQFFIPHIDDLLIVFSTFDGYNSFRRKKEGSWFIQSLCKVFTENAETDSLQDLILGITRKVAFEYQSSTDEIEKNQKKQIPTTLSTLTKRFYFTKNKSTGASVLINIFKANFENITWKLIIFGIIVLILSFSKCLMNRITKIF